MKELDPRLRGFVEKMGLLMERGGTSRTFGRLLGLLLVTDEPLSLDEMAALLHVSKASISTNARQGEQLDLMQRVSIPGDRRNYYEILPGTFERAFASGLTRLHDMVELAEEGRAAVGHDHATAQARLEEMRDFYTYLGEALHDALARWGEGTRSRKNPVPALDSA